MLSGEGQPFLFLGALTLSLSFAQQCQNWIIEAKRLAIENGYPWVGYERYKHTSLTELEIIELCGNVSDGTLDCAANPNIFFYFASNERTENAAQRISGCSCKSAGCARPNCPREVKRKALSPRMVTAQQRARMGWGRLEELKEKIRNSFPAHCVKNFSSPEELGVYILDDWKQLVDEYAPAGPLVRCGTSGWGLGRGRQWAEYWCDLEAAHRALAVQEAYGEALRARQVPSLEEETNLGVSTPKNVAASRAALDREYSSGRYPIVVLESPNGGHCSPFVADWVRRRRTANPKLFQITHFLGCDVGAAQPLHLLRRLLGELRLFRIGREPLAEAAVLNSATRLSRLLGETLLEEDDEPCLVVVDGAHLMHRRGGHARAAKLLDTLEWLPDVGDLSGSTRFLVSGEPGDPLLTALQRRGDVVTVRLGMLDEADRGLHLETLLGRQCKTLEEADKALILQCGLSEQPAFLGLLVDELLFCTGYRQVTPRIEEYMSANDLSAVHNRMITRWGELGPWVHDALRLLYVSLRGLRDEDIIGALNLLRRSGSWQELTPEWAYFKVVAKNKVYMTPGGQITIGSAYFNAVLTLL